MRRLVIAALTLAAVGAVAGSALAAAGGGKAGVIYDSTEPNGPPTNQPSLGPEAYAFTSLGDKITFAPGTARSLTGVTVTLSSWACQQGTWYDKNCATQAGATFSQPITLRIYDAGDRHLVAESTQTFDVPYRPSASPKCTGDDAGKWYQASAKACKNGIAHDVTFNFSNQRLPDSVVYEISYDTNNSGPSPLHAAGPYDSLNIAVTDKPSVGSTDDSLLTDGAPNPEFGGYTPAVQFKAANAG